MKFIKTIFLSASVPLLIVSCTSPATTQDATAGTFQDPNNPYAVPGLSNQGADYAPSAQAPYQSIPSSPINPPASIPTYTPSVSSSTATSSGSSHTVGAGDTLWGLSRKYGVSVAEIKQANGLSSDLISKGQSLSIPR